MIYMQKIMNSKLARLLTVFLAVICFGVCSVAAQKTYVVAVGLDNYESGENPLPCAVNDARGIAKLFNGMGNTEVFMLKDSNATRSHILRVLKDMFAKSTANDQIIFAYSGHGFDGGLSCYDRDKFIWCSEIQEIMRNSKARRKIMFINSCHSGSFTKKYNNSTANDTRRNSYKNKNVPVMLYLSSRAEEPSWAMTGMAYSFFVNRLIQGLQGYADANGDNKVTARELFNYVNSKVISDTGQRQHPQMYGNFADDMVIVYTDR